MVRALTSEVLLGGVNKHAEKVPMGTQIQPIKIEI